MTAPRKWILFWTALGLIIDLRWIPSFNNLAAEVTWSNVPWIMCFSTLFFLVFYAVAKLGHMIVQRTYNRHPLSFNPYSFDILKARLHIRWFYLGGTGHYLCLLIIFARSADLLLLWLSLVLFGIAVIDPWLNKALKLEVPHD